MCGGNAHLDILGKLKSQKERLRKTGCTVCENDYLTVFPKLAVMFYAAMKHIKVQFDTDKVIGIPLEMYLPEENAAIETVSGTEEIETLKAYLCRKREIKLIKHPLYIRKQRSRLRRENQKSVSQHTYFHNLE